MLDKRESARYCSNRMDVFSIGMTAKLTGLTGFTLRAWERRYGAARPRRSPSGRRIYTRREVEKLKTLKALTDSGHSIGEIARLNLPELQSLLRRNARPSGARETISRILEAVEDCDLAALSAHLKAARLERDVRAFLLEVISPALSEIGRLVAEGELDVYHEHAASAMIRNLLSGILYSVERAPQGPAPKTIVFAAPAGDHHEFGILISAILVSLRGEKAIYLGPNMPAESLARAAQAMRASAVAVGCSAPASSLPGPAWRRFVNELCAQVDPSVPLWLGGVRSSEVAGLASLAKRKVALMSRFDDLDKAIGRLRV